MSLNMILFDYMHKLLVIDVFWYLIYLLHNGKKWYFKFELLNWWGHV